MWWKKKLPLMGMVLFRGTLPPRADEFASLAEQGIGVGRAEGGPHAPWRLELSHRAWGQAEMLCTREMNDPPAILIELARMSGREKKDALSGQVYVMVRMQPRGENLLGDRKHLLRYLRAIMGESGVAAVDLLSSRVWTREALDDELQHEADLDVESLYTVHAVREEAAGGGGSSPEAQVAAPPAPGGADDGALPYWLHTHGLGEIGGFDFDILGPSQDVCGRGGADTFRAMAFLVVERAVQLNTPRFTLAYPGGEAATVEVNAFLKQAPAAVRQRLREAGQDDFHLRNRAVLCEPRAEGWLRRLLGGGKVRPSRFLSEPAPDEMMVFFSTQATELMARRARQTYGVFRRLGEELKEFGFPTLAKLGFVVDGGGQNDREHMWFEVHQCLDDAVDGTLGNAPFKIARMKQGDRGRHGLDLLSDWTILSPMGPITPRDLAPARLIAEHRDELLEMLRKHRQEHPDEQ